MPNVICTSCGTQYAETPARPDRCSICEDERQYIGWGGQRWTTLDDLRSGHENRIRTEEPGLTGIGTTPRFGIGQRALLVQSPGGNVLWDCISLIDEATIGAVNDLGGLAAIAVSHPHYYSSMAERIEALRGLMERLCAPDLTLPEANVLRGRLFELLGMDVRGGDVGQPASLPPIALSYGRGDWRGMGPRFPGLRP